MNNFHTKFNFDMCCYFVAVLNANIRIDQSFYGYPKMMLKRKNAQEQGFLLIINLLITSHFCKQLKICNFLIIKSLGNARSIR